MNLQHLESRIKQLENTVLNLSDKLRELERLHKNLSEILDDLPKPFKVGDKVICRTYGVGVVEKIFVGNYLYPLLVAFNEPGKSISNRYTLDGKNNAKDEKPSLTHFKN